MYASLGPVYQDVMDDIATRINWPDGVADTGALSMATSENAYKMAIGGLSIVGPILTLIGMTFFCCQLKKIHSSEGCMAALCGGIWGCLIMPLLMLVAAILSIAAAVFMGLMAGYLYDPMAVMSWTDQINDCSNMLAHPDVYDMEIADIPSDHECKANDMEAWKALANIAYYGSLEAIKGNLCNQDMYSVDPIAESHWTYAADPTDYYVPDTVPTDYAAEWYNPQWDTYNAWTWEDPTWDTPAAETEHREAMHATCETFSTAFRAGLAGMALNSITSLWGLIITLWVGYKSCSGSSKDENGEDIQLDDIEQK